MAAALTILVAVGCSSEQAPAEAAGPASPDAEWPQWRGPRRDGLSTETGLLDRWPDAGPPLAWKASGIGGGFATVSIAGGIIYTAGNIDKKTVITALDLEGNILWQAANGPAWTKDHPGARGTPTIDGERLYHESPLGRVTCLNARSGKELWAVDILERFDGRNIRWALAESLLVDGQKVVACPGGEKATVVALDKKTGETLWVCDSPADEDKPGYTSPIVFDYQGLRHIVTMTAKAAIGLNAENGKFLWRHPHKTSYDANIPTPIFHDGRVFICSGYGSGAELLQLQVRGQEVSVRRLWQQKALDNHHGGVILVDGYLYGSDHKGRWVCLDFETGEVQYREGGVGKGSLTYADGMLYTYSQGGTAGLVPCTPEGHEVVSQFKLPREGKGPYWAHPVICGGRLYLRHDDYLYAYDVKAR